MTENHQNKKDQTKSAIFASGCFWGTEHYISSSEGVTNTTVGYTGGKLEEPSYEDVSSGSTKHVEAVLVEYNPSETDFEHLAQLFFETHNFEQKAGQGPDIGLQYESKIFYDNKNEKDIAEKLIYMLKKMGYDVATKVEKRSIFWPAEEYHQKYYKKSNQKPYCRSYKKIF